METINIGKLYSFIDNVKVKEKQYDHAYYDYHKAIYKSIDEILTNYCQNYRIKLYDETRPPIVCDCYDGRRYKIFEISKQRTYTYHNELTPSFIITVCDCAFAKTENPYFITIQLWNYDTNDIKRIFNRLIEVVKYEIVN